MPPYDMGTWARTLLDHEYDDDSEYNVDSYNMPVKDVDKELSPKSMKRYAMERPRSGKSAVEGSPSLTPSPHHKYFHFCLISLLIAI